MIDAVWTQILERIPPEQHANLSLITCTGAELVIQQIFKMERDFLIIRARTAGTGDLGRTVLLPFSQIDFLAFGGIMTEEVVNSMFGEPMPEIAAPQMMPQMYQPVTTPAPPPVAPAPRPAPRTFAPPPEPPAPAVEEPTPVVEPAAAEAPAQKPGQISKTVLLARLRERLAEKAR